MDAAFPDVCCFPLCLIQKRAGPICHSHHFAHSKTCALANLQKLSWLCVASAHIGTRKMISLLILYFLATSSCPMLGRSHGQFRTKDLSAEPGLLISLLDMVDDFFSHGQICDYSESLEFSGNTTTRCHADCAIYASGQAQAIRHHAAATIHWLVTNAEAYLNREHTIHATRPAFSQNGNIAYKISLVSMQINC